MAVFGKKSESGGVTDESDFVRIPAGTRIGQSGDGKLSMSFAGDMSFGEALPELAEINCGRNLSIDAGVKLHADIVKVKAALELEAGSKLVCRELEVDRLVSRKGQLEVRSLNAGQIELEGSKVVADRVLARDNVLIDRGEVEIGTVMAQTLTVTKGTTANILITEVAKLDGAITKGGYENFNELLQKMLLYHPELLNDRFTAEARKQAGTTGGAPAPATTGAAGSTSEAAAEEPDPALVQRVSQEALKLRAIYASIEKPKEIEDLLADVEAGRVHDVRRKLTPVYQKLAPQGKMPEPATEVFRELQKILRDGPRSKKDAQPA